MAREIVGIFESVFPRLLPGAVAYMNRQYLKELGECERVPDELIKRSSLQRAMLAEIAIAAAEVMHFTPKKFDWESVIACAVNRQRRFYDAIYPERVEEDDRVVALRIAENLVAMLRYCEQSPGGKIHVEPAVPGYGWIANGKGDYAIGNAIVEVKCTANQFTSADYRQVAIYWLLSYVEALEKGGTVWEVGILLNPRRNAIVEMPLDEFVSLISGSRSTVEVVQSFGAFYSQLFEQDGTGR